MLVVVSSRKLIPKPLIRVLAFSVILELQLLGDLVILVVAGIDDDGRVVTESPDVLRCFERYRLAEGWPCGIVAASKHKVLPDKYPQLIAQFVEHIFFIYAASPYPDSPKCKSCRKVSDSGQDWLHTLSCSGGLQS